MSRPASRYQVADLCLTILRDLAPKTRRANTVDAIHEIEGHILSWSDRQQYTHETVGELHGLAVACARGRDELNDRYGRNTGYTGQEPECHRIALTIAAVISAARKDR
jgi:hypothetical protein